MQETQEVPQEQVGGSEPVVESNAGGAAGAENVTASDQDTVADTTPQPGQEAGEGVEGDGVPQTAPVAETEDAAVAEQATKDPRTELVDKIMALDESLSQTVDGSEVNRQALAEMDVKELQVIHDAEFSKVLAKTIVEIDQQQNPDNPQYNEATLKKLPPDALIAINQQLNEKYQDDLLEQRVGLDEVTEVTKVELEPDGLTFADRWYGDNGLIKGALATQYGEQYRQELIKSQEYQQMQQQIAQELVQRYEFLTNEEKQQYPNVEAFQAVKQDEIDQRSKAWIESQVQQKVNEEFEELANIPFKEGLNKLMGSSAAETEDSSIIEVSSSDSETEEKKKLLTKDKIIQFLKAQGIELAKKTIDTLGQSNFFVILQLMLVGDKGRMHQSSIDSYSKENKVAGQVGLGEFRDLVQKNKEPGESTFAAYDKVISKLLEAHYRLDKKTPDEKYISALEDNDQAGLNEKLEKLYEVLDSLLSTDVQKANQLFVWAFSDVAGDGNLKGDYPDKHIISQAVISHFKLLQQQSEYEEYILES